MTVLRAVQASPRARGSCSTLTTHVLWISHVFLGQMRSSNKVPPPNTCILSATRNQVGHWYMLRKYRHLSHSLIQKAPGADLRFQDIDGDFYVTIYPPLLSTTGELPSRAWVEPQDSFLHNIYTLLWACRWNSFFLKDKLVNVSSAPISSVVSVFSTLGLAVCIPALPTGNCFTSAFLFWCSLSLSLSFPPPPLCPYVREGACVRE